jgi:hypothetical protein
VTLPEPRKSRRIRAWWVALAAVPFGFTTWAAFLYAGLRTKRRDLLVASGVYGAMLVGYVVLDTAGHARGPDLAIGTILALGAWIGGFIHALAVRRSVEAQLELVDSSAVEAASRVLARRQYGRELVRTQPALAKQLGIGRPDLPNSATLPGMTDELARRVADFCREGGSFVSVEDLGLFLDLPAPAVDAMREQAVFPKEE